MKRPIHHLARSRPVRAGAIALAAAVVLTACGVSGSSGDNGGDTGHRRLRMMIPNSPGGGYDQTGRAAAQVLESEKITGRFEISNVIGASGVVAMQRLLNEKASDDLVMTMGLGVVGAVYTNKSNAKVSKATPIARLIEDQEAILVPKNSPFKTVDDFVKAWKDDPGAVAVGGGSAPGGPDHLFPMQLAKEVGVTPKKVNFITYDGGGPLTSALLGSKVDVGMSGPGEFEGQIADGSLRVLAMSGAERVKGIDAPTLKESGINLEFLNWRGVLAPPGITDKQRDELIGLFEKMHKSAAWKKALAKNGWTDAFITGDEFSDYLTSQDQRVASTLKELGLA